MSYIEQCQECFESSDEGKICEKCEWGGFDANEHLDYFHEAVRLGELYKDLLLVLDALDVSPEHQLAITRDHTTCDHLQLHAVAVLATLRRLGAVPDSVQPEGWTECVKSVEKAIAEAVSAPYSDR